MLSNCLLFSYLKINIPFLAQYLFWVCCLQGRKNKGTTLRTKGFPSYAFQPSPLRPPANPKASVASLCSALPISLGAYQFRRGSYTSQLPKRHSRKHPEERALDGKSNIIVVNMFLSHLGLIFVLPHMAHCSDYFQPQQLPSLLELCVLSTWGPRQVF